MSIVFSIPILAAGFATASFSAPAPPQTRIETDPKTGAILFIVNGHEEARISTDGLHVRQHIAYGGAITDVGKSGYTGAEGKGKP